MMNHNYPLLLEILCFIRYTLVCSASLKNVEVSLFVLENLRELSSKCTSIKNMYIKLLTIMEPSIRYKEGNIAQKPQYFKHCLTV